MHILYTTDGSAGALAGAHLLAAVPLAPEDQIQVLTVVQHEEEEADGEPALAAARGALGGSAARVTTAVRRGDGTEETVEEILDAAEEQPADLIVVGTQGRSGIVRFFLGSVAERVARHAPCPVLLARPLRGGLDRVVVGVDGSACSEQAASWLRGFPLPPECKTRLVTVVTPMEAVTASRMMHLSGFADQMRTLAEREHEEAKERLEALGASFESAGKPVSREVLSDDPASGLLAASEEHQADLIVVGSQGLTGVERFLIGSVSEKVLRHAPCSVAVVRGSDRG